MNNLFSLYWFDNQGSQHIELKHKRLRDLGSAWTRLTRGPAAKLGIVKRVIITDALDCIALEYNSPR